MAGLVDVVTGVIGGIGDAAIKIRQAITGKDPVADARLAELASALDAQKAQAETGLLQGQLEINKVEAASTDKFVSRWRPAAGWVGVVALALATWPKAVVLTIMWLVMVIKTGILSPFPDLGTAEVIMLLGSMLGIAGMRTAEKFKGVASK
jgi:hypothetical protein